MASASASAMSTPATSSNTSLQLARSGAAAIGGGSGDGGAEVAAAAVRHDDLQGRRRSATAGSAERRWAWAARRGRRARRPRSAGARTDRWAGSTRRRAARRSKAAGSIATPRHQSWPAASRECRRPRRCGVSASDGDRRRHAASAPRMLARQRGQRRARADFEQHARRRRRARARARRRSAPARAGGAPSSAAESRVVGVEPVAGDGRDDRQLRRVRARPRRPRRGTARPPHPSSRSGRHARCCSVAAGDALGFELRPGSCSIASLGPATTQTAGRVLGRQRQRLRAGAAQLVGRQAHRQHAAGGQRLHQRAAPRDQAQRVGEANHAGQRRRRRIRRRCGRSSRPASRRRLIHSRASAYSSAKVAGCVTAVGSSASASSPNTRSRRSKPSSPRQRLRRTRRTRRGTPARARTARGPCRRTARPGPGTGRRRRCAAPARLRAAAAVVSAVRSASAASPASSATTQARCANGLAADAQRARDVGQVASRCRLEMVGQPRRRRARAPPACAPTAPAAAARCAASDGAQRAALPRAPRAHWCRRRRSELTPARRGAPSRGQSRSAVVDARTASAAKSIAGFGAVEMQRWPGCACVVQRQRGLDQAGGAGGDHQVADVALERADAAEAGVVGAAAERAWSGLRSRSDRPAASRCRAPRRRRCCAASTPASAMRHRDHRRLAVAARRGEAGLVRRRRC